MLVSARHHKPSLKKNASTFLHSQEKILFYLPVFSILHSLKVLGNIILVINFLKNLLV